MVVVLWLLFSQRYMHVILVLQEYEYTIQI